MSCRARPSAGGRGTSIASGGPLDRERRSAAASPSPSFLPVEVADGAGLVAGPTAASQERIEIALPDGVLVRVGAGFDAAALRRVLAVLGP
jgi:hypothetical protein